jgi:hypothetical protein
MQLKFAAVVASALALAVGSSSAASVLVPRQSSTNVVVNLSVDFNNPTVLSLIDQNLPSGTSRTSGIQLAWMPWNQVPGVVKTRAKKPHSANDPVIRISMRIHVNTPWWCLAVDGSIIYYLFPDNSEFLLAGLVDSWDTLTDLISACSSSVNNQLQQVVPTKISLLQSLVNFIFSQLPDEHFGSYQLLPLWTGSVDENDPVQLVLERDTIVSRWNDFCMDIQGGSTANGALVLQSVCSHTNEQRYDKIAVSDGFFMIRNRNSQKCLAISNGETENGALIAQYDCNSEDFNHHWRSVDPGGNSVGAKWLINRNSGMCVEVPGWSTTPGTLLSQLDCVGAWKHYWYNV